MTDRRQHQDEETRRILSRVAQESDPSGSLAARAANRVRDHMSAVDADQEDRIEVWGTRIGRIIAAAALLAFIVWLVPLIFAA